MLVGRFSLERSVGQLDLDVEPATQAAGAAQSDSTGVCIDVPELKGSFQNLCCFVGYLDAQFETSEIRFTLNARSVSTG